MFYLLTAQSIGEKYSEIVLGGGSSVLGRSREPVKGLLHIRLQTSKTITVVDPNAAKNCVELPDNKPGSGPNRLKTLEIEWKIIMV